MSIFAEFLRAPARTGAVCASSSHLARLICDTPALRQASTAVELGPGDGVFTQRILEAIPKECRFLALEANQRLRDELTQRVPGVIVHADDAANLPAYVEPGTCNCIISGLPFATFPAHAQQSILNAVSRSLGPGGEFRTFAYLQGAALPSGIRFRRMLHETFPLVRRTRIEWRNLPPAYVYSCMKSSKNFV
jgi:phosphatidylethanolamine/phosphatidyl-N-methylethanolamine N-methyltransferase